METKWKSIKKVQLSLILNDLEEGKVLTDRGDIDFRGQYFGIASLDLVIPCLLK